MSAFLCIVYILVFVALCVLVMRLTARRSILWASVAVTALGLGFLLVAFPGLRLGSLTIPGIAMLATGSDLPLPVPAFAFWTYVVLIAVGVLLVASASEQTLKEFVDPILRILRGGPGLRARWIRAPALFGAIPLVVAGLAFGTFLPPSAPPLVDDRRTPLSTMTRASPTRCVSRRRRCCGSMAAPARRSSRR